jgi:hypothetical protein
VTVSLNCINQLIFIVEREPDLAEVGTQLFRKIFMKVRQFVTAERNAEKTFVKTVRSNT